MPVSRCRTNMFKKAGALLLSLAAAVCCILPGCSPALDILDQLSGYADTAEDSSARQESPMGATEIRAGARDAADSPSARVSDTPPAAAPASGDGFRYEDVPEYAGDPYVAVNSNVPFFTQIDLTEIPPSASLGATPAAGDVQSFEVYSDLDALGRCGPATSAVGLDIMPTTKRESISEVKPTGWKQAFYEFVDGEALYNRCHLLGYQLTAENANPYNLITGTRYMNTQGMLPFENMVADYVKETGNHVLYRVTPVFVGDELLARGVLLEARSIEDDGEGVEYCTFAYNVEPGVGIDYSTGRNWLASESSDGAPAAQHFVLNTGTMKFHEPDCTNIADINPSRKQDYVGTREDLIAAGYEPCGGCRP